MTELEMLERAKVYMGKLANGVNPIDDSIVPENDTLNNVRLSRCFFYVSDVLRQLIEQGGITPVKKPKTKLQDFAVSFEEIQKYPFSDEPLSITKIAERINGLISSENMKKISYKYISQWFTNMGMLEDFTKPDGKTTKRPTVSGNEMGITTEVRTGSRGEYVAVLFNRNAQQFLIDNIDAVIDLMNNKE